MYVCLLGATHAHVHTHTHTHTVPQFQLQDSSVYGIEKESTRGKEVLISHQTRGEKHLMNNNEDNNAIMLMIWMRVRGVCVCARVCLVVVSTSWFPPVGWAETGFSWFGEQWVGRHCWHTNTPSLSSPSLARPAEEIQQRLIWLDYNMMFEQLRNKLGCRSTYK